MKRVISLIVFISSFAGAMDAPLVKQQKQNRTLAQAPRVPSLLALCENKIAPEISNMSLVDFLHLHKLDQFQLRPEFTNRVVTEILNKYPQLRSHILEQIEIPCAKTLTGHARPITSVAFSPDGTKIVTGSWDKTAKVWNAKTGECLHTLTGTSVAFSPDGTKIVTGSFDNKAKVWDTQTGECRQTLNGHTDWINSVAFSPDGKYLVTGSDDKTIRIWDVKTGKCLHTLNDHTGWINRVAFSPDGKYLASGSNDKTIRIWDVKTGTCLHTLNGHTKEIHSVAFSPDGQYLVASASTNKTIKIWDMRSFNALSTLTIPQALLLKEWYTAQQEQQEFNIDNKLVKKVLDSLPQEIQSIIGKKDCSICFNSYPGKDFYTCSECKNKICNTCKNKWIRTARPTYVNNISYTIVRCPYCRHEWQRQNNE